MYAATLTTIAWIGKKMQRCVRFFQERRLAKAKRDVILATKAIEAIDSFKDPDKEDISIWDLMRQNWIAARISLGTVRNIFVLIVGKIPSSLRWLSVIAVLIGSLLDGNEPLPVL